MSYQYSGMSPAQIEEFLQAPRHAIVGTNRHDGPPQLTPVWYLFEDEWLFVSINVGSAKYRNLLRDPRIGTCIAGDHPDARAVMMYGTAQLIREDSAWRDDIEWRIVRRYYDSDEAAQSYLESLPSDEESVLVKVSPDKVIAQDFN